MWDETPYLFPVASLEFGNGYVISPHISMDVFLIHPRNKVNLCLEKEFLVMSTLSQFWVPLTMVNTRLVTLKKGMPSPGPVKWKCCWTYGDQNSECDIVETSFLPYHNTRISTSWRHGFYAVNAYDRVGSFYNYRKNQYYIHGKKEYTGLDWICLTTTHVLQNILVVLHK